MKPLFDHHHRPIALGAKLGSGGEGAVFELAGVKDLVAKIYHKPPTAEKLEKLRAMVALADPQLTKFASWPVATAHERPGGAIVGVLIPRVRDHEEIHNLYSPAHRKVKFPKADWHFLAHVAMNCAAAFEGLHESGHVIGDVNQGNVLASERGTIFLIDCDSFQIQAAGQKYLCQVGVPQFTPPELQGRSFNGLERTKNHDCFGLAVLIFHLLFLGRHPYAGRCLGRGEMPIEKAIQEYRYAFSESAAKLQMAQPPYTLPMTEVVTLDFARLFERAFDRGSESAGARPSAQEWRAALQALIGSLQPCPVDRGHKYSRAMTDCPWCVLIRTGAPNFFVSVTIKNIAGQFEQTTAIAMLWREITQMPTPAKLTITAPPRDTPIVVPRPLPENIELSRGFSTMLGGVALGAAIASLGGMVVENLALVTLPIAFVFGIWWMLMHFTSTYTAEKNRRWRSLRGARAASDKFQRVWKQCVAQLENRYLLLRKELAEVVDQSQKLKPQYERELRIIEKDRATQQLRLFLDSRFLTAYDIPQIGAGRKTLLASYGIETAADIDAALIQQIPGFGPSLTASLVAWRLSMERQFKYDPAQAMPPAVRQAVALKYAQLRQQQELRLRDGVMRLRRILEETQASGAAHHSQAVVFEDALRQAQADYDLLRLARRK
jgi:DNA-binding helix-hairpin-helix protein with protein kinase domain